MLGYLSSDWVFVLVLCPFSSEAVRRYPRGSSPSYHSTILMGKMESAGEAPACVEQEEKLVKITGPVLDRNIAHPGTHRHSEASQHYKKNDKEGRSEKKKEWRKDFFFSN